MSGVYGSFQLRCRLTSKPVKPCDDCLNLLLNPLQASLDLLSEHLLRIELLRHRKHGDDSLGVRQFGQSLSTPSVLNGFLLKPTEDKAVLFIDEIHELNRAGQTALYRAMEERVVFLTNQYSDSVTKLETVRFTLMAATTDPQFLLPPLRDRFRLVCQIQPYAEDELVSILRQRIRQLGWVVEEACLVPIAQRSFGTPRLALRLLESARRTARSYGMAAIEHQHIERTLELEQLDEYGLGADEQKYLRLLSDTAGPIRLGVLASKLKVSIRTVSHVIEERLIYLDLIERLPQGRVLTAKGVEHVAALNARAEVHRA